MQHLSRLAVGAAAALSVALAGCADDDPGIQTTAPGGAVPTDVLPPTAGSAPPTAGQGVTQAADVYGPGCNQIPTEGTGSLQDMADDPVGTAAANNPLLTRLNQAVQAAGLTDTLNDANASYTVFAPTDSAFNALPPGTLDQVLADPQGQLTSILTYHVVPQRFDAQGLADAGTVTTVQGTPLTISGEPSSLVIDEQEQASVLCGNIPTANATVFVVDKVSCRNRPRGWFLEPEYEQAVSVNRASGLLPTAEASSRSISASWTRKLAVPVDSWDPLMSPAAYSRLPRVGAPLIQVP
jgi:uncharacterized surface protein with fasciclin (FAS1) repeats